MNQSNASTRLIIFAKAPKPGFAKTRLIPELGTQGAAQIARQLLDHTVAVACSTQFKTIELCVTPCPPDSALEAIAHTANMAISCQTSGDLGARMSAAFAAHLEYAPKVLLIGTDAPGLTADMLHEASQQLDTHDAVFIPALDGGYALIGLRRHHARLFADIPWSTASVMAATRNALIKAGLDWFELAPLHDIDDPEDLIHLPDHWTQ